MPRTYCLRLLLSAATLLAPLTAAAQRPLGEDLGSEAERRRLSAALAGDSDSATSNPPALAASLGLRLNFNSAFPSSVEPGAAWTGRGATSTLQPRVAARWRGLTLVLAPELWSSANRPPRLIPGAPAANPYADAMRPCCIDLPQRLGPGAVARLDPGQSALELRALGARVAFTSAAVRIGPGLSHGILLSPDAPGFPRVEIGTSRPFRTPIGDFQGTLAAGEVGQTAWAPDRRTGSRSGSFLEARWRPLSNDNLELGGARFYNRDWKGARFRDLLAPFGSLFVDAQTFQGAAADNQLVSIFGVIRSPAAGFELWAEFGLNDRQTDFRELVVELEHNSAWLFGLRRAWLATDGALWSVEATGASAKIPPIERFRVQSIMYEHFPVTQGHTNRGHLLGTRLLERNGGSELRIDRQAARGRIGLILGTRDLSQDRALAVTEDRIRREWTAVAEWWRPEVGGLEWFARLGAIADLNRHPGRGDEFSAVVTTGVTWRP